MRNWKTGWKTGYSSTLDFWLYSVYFTYTRRKARWTPSGGPTAGRNFAGPSAMTILNAGWKKSLEHPANYRKVAKENRS